MAKLEHLVVTNFRGASTKLRLDFDKSKPITVIFGENGTGKSTIADALDAMGNGSAGSLNDRSSVKAKDHLPTIGKKSADIQIELKAGGKTWTATVGKDGIPTGADPRPKIRVLRRAQLLQMVNAEPSKRYEELKRFIDVQRVEAAEATLKAALTSAKRSFDQVVSQRTSAESQLNEVWIKEGKPGSTAMEWAKAVASSDQAALMSKARQLREASTAVNTSEQRLADLDRAIQAVNEKQQEVATVEAEVENLPEVDGKQVMALTGLLSKAADFLSAWGKDDQCPVCEQGIPLDKLKAEIQSRMKELAPYEAVRAKQESASRSAHTVQMASTPQRDQFLASARPLVGMLSNGELDPISALKLDPNNYSELAKTTGFDENLSVKQARELLGSLSPLRAALDQDADGASRKAAQITSVDTLYKTYTRSVIESESHEKTHTALEGALAIVQKTRIDFTQSILDAVSGECNRLYGQVHPKESVSISKIEMDPDKRASLNQKADFEGYAGVTPQAYFSESHLDTLAFCFWLALIKREFPNKDAVLVLDDVFTSVDAQHLSRIAQLIVDESQHFAHVVVTTHQRMWRDIYKNPHGAGGRTQLIELQRWALSKGISNFKTKLALAELAQTLSATPFERQTTASKAGILLEAALDGLALQYRARVPRTPDGNYTLGELLDATSSLFKKLEIARPVFDATGNPLNPPQITTVKPETFVTTLRGMAFIRNQVGAHFNAPGAEIPDCDVQAFADQTVQLVQALSCVSCGQIPGKAAGSHFECSCQSTHAVRMLPLQLS